MSAIVIGRNSVEKARETVQAQLVINKLWIADVLIDIIKDFLYIDSYEVLRRYYKKGINRSISSLVSNVSYLHDMLGRPRLAHWMIGHTSGKLDIQIQNTCCVPCGKWSFEHGSLNGCCALDEEDENEPLELVDESIIQDESIVQEEDVLQVEYEYDSDFDWRGELEEEVNARDRRGAPYRDF